MIDFFGAFSIEASYIVIGLTTILLTAVILLIVFVVKTSKLKKKYESFMIGSDGKSIENIIKENIKDVKEIKSSTENNSKAIKDIYDKLQFTYCKVGMIKYDAFHEMGGKLSFALCMLDKMDNGFLVNVMHSNDGCFAYIKEIVNGKSFIELGKEEQQALKEALAGKSGSVDLSPKINKMLSEDVKVD